MDDELNETIESTEDEDVVNDTSDSSGNSSNGLLSKIKTGFTKAKQGIGNSFRDAKNAIFNKIESNNRKKELLNIFETKATTFLYMVDKKPKVVKGIRNISEQTIQFLMRDKDVIHGNMELSVDGQCLIIQEYDLKDIVSYTFDTFAPVSLESFKAYYKPKEHTVAPSQSIVQTNNITVGDNFQGDINAVNQAKLLSDLNQIEDALKRAKPGLFHKAQLKDANDMFVNFKSSMINNEKPKQTFLDKFISLLKVVAPAAVSLVLGLV